MNDEERPVEEPSEQLAGPKKPESVAIGLGVICCLLWLSSAAFPALAHPKEEETLGGKLLLVGWAGIQHMMQEPGYLGWIANPIFALAVLAMMGGWYGTALISSACAAGLAALSFRLVPSNVAPGLHKAIVGVGPGFYVWQAAMGLSFVGSLGLFLLSRYKSAGLQPTDEDAQESQERYG